MRGITNHSLELGCHLTHALPPEFFTLRASALRDSEMDGGHLWRWQAKS